MLIISGHILAEVDTIFDTAKNQFDLNYSELFYLPGFTLFSTKGT